MLYVVAELLAEPSAHLCATQHCIYSTISITNQENVAMWQPLHKDDVITHICMHIHMFTTVIMEKMLP